MRAGVDAIAPTASARTLRMSTGVGTESSLLRTDLAEDANRLPDTALTLSCTSSLA